MHWCSVRIFAVPAGRSGICPRYARPGSDGSARRQAVGRYEYALLLAAGWLCLLFVERRVGTGIVRCWRRTLPIVALVAGCGLAWDSLGVHRGYWCSDPHRVI